MIFRGNVADIGYFKMKYSFNMKLVGQAEKSAFVD